MLFSFSLFATKFPSFRGKKISEKLEKRKKSCEKHEKILRFLFAFVYLHQMS